MRRSLGLDWGAGEARWVELVEERGHATVRAFGTVELPAREGGAVEALRALVAQQRWRGREVVAALERSAVTLTWLGLPSAAREDLAAMVELEAAQTLPFPVEEAAWDFAAEPGRDGAQSVLLVAARRQFAEEKRRRLEAAGVRLGALTVDVLATAALARSGATEGTSGAVVVRLDAGGVTLSSLDGDRLLMSRTATLTPGTGPQAWDAAALALEVRRTMAAGAASAGGVAPEMDTVWLTGLGADAGLAEALGTALWANGGTPARVALLPRAGIEGAEPLSRSLDLALGLALLGLRAHGPHTVDAIDLGRSVRAAAEASASRPHRNLPILAGVGVAAVAIAFLLLNGPSPEDRQLASAASRAQAEVKLLATRREQLTGRVRTLTGAVAPRHSYLDVLNEVSTLAGSQIWLTQFSYDRGRPIVIRGSAKSSAAVASAVERLRGSPHLQQVALGAMTTSETNKTGVVQFTIEGTLRGDAPLQAARRRRAPSTRTPTKEPA